MRLKRLLSLVIAAALLASGVWVIAQEGEEMTPEQQKMMELMMKYGTPGEHHKMLESSIGEWDIVTKWWPAPGAPADESNATSKVEWILDGRYIMETVEGMMDEEIPFTGIGIVGYDIYGQKFNSLWIDNMSTMFFLQTGTCNEDGSVFNFEGTYDDIMTGQKNKVSKSTITVLDNDKRVMEMFDTAADGKEYKSMELTYTRKK